MTSFRQLIDERMLAAAKQNINKNIIKPLPELNVRTMCSAQNLLDDVLKYC